MRRDRVSALQSRDLLERHGVLRLLVYVVTLIALLYAAGLIWSIIVHFGGVILLFFLAWVVAFVLQPLSTFMERHRVPRLLAVTLIYLSLVVLVSGSIVLAFPVIHDEVAQIAAEVTTALAPGSLNQLAGQAVRTLHHLGLRPSDARALVRQVSNQIPGATTNLADMAVAATTNLLQTAALLLFDAFVVLILSFYVMLDGGRLVEASVQKLPPSWIPDIRLLQRHVELVFGGFLRAQLITGAVYGALTYVVLTIFRLPNGLIFSLLAGIFVLIPFIGPFLALVPPAMLVILQATPRSIVVHLAMVLIALVIAQQITMQVIAPRVMSAHVGLHPLLLFAALLVGVKEGGVWGAVFAGPIAAVIVATLDTFFERFQRASPLYPHVTAEADSTAAVAPADHHTADAAEAQAAGPGAEPSSQLAVGRSGWDSHKERRPHQSVAGESGGHDHEDGAPHPSPRDATPVSH
jgi:predicted PurR-regulated permease PerM